MANFLENYEHEGQYQRNRIMNTKYNRYNGNDPQQNPNRNNNPQTSKMVTRIQPIITTRITIKGIIIIGVITILIIMIIGIIEETGTTDTT